jgi:hypothetical protein
MGLRRPGESADYRSMRWPVQGAMPSLCQARIYDADRLDQRAGPIVLEFQPAISDRLDRETEALLITNYQRAEIGTSASWHRIR